MPSTLQKTLRLGILLTMLCLTGLASPIRVCADELMRTSEPTSTNRSGEIYRAFHAKPQQANVAYHPSYSKNALRFSKPTHQTAPLAVLINEGPTNQLRNQSSNSRFTHRFANQIATTDNGQVNPVNHLQLSQESKATPIPLPRSSPTPIALSPKGKTGEKEQKSSGILPMVITMGGALLLVVGLFLVFAWTMRRTSTRTGGLLPQGVVEVLGHQQIAGRQQVHLLRIGKRLLLVSVMPDSIETLTEITDPMEVDRIAGICRQSGSGSSTGAFQAVMRQFNQDPNPTTEPVPTVSQLRQRLGS